MKEYDPIRAQSTSQHSLTSKKIHTTNKMNTERQNRIIRDHIAGPGTTGTIILAMQSRELTCAISTEMRKMSTEF